MLFSLILIPLIGALSLTLIKNDYNIKKFSLVISLINLLISAILWIKFDYSCHEYQFVEEWTNIGFCHFHLGVDGISLPFVILTTFIIPICILVSWSSINHGIRRYFMLFLILESLLIAVFIVLDLLLFYITFESCLIPMFLIIGIWGSRERKVHAAMMFFLYTLLGSLFMLFAILVIYSAIGSTDFQILSLTEISKVRQNILWLGIFLSLAVKTPMIPFHLWLPEAHVEAPVGGSVILAGVLLKLATYGFLRVCLPILPEASNYFTPFIYTIATISIIYSSFTTLRQIDLKKIIAYSSIGHMSIGVLGIFSNTLQGIEGAILLSIAHGIVSPALFICVGILYDRYHSRLIKYYRGLVISMPLFAVFFFIFTLANMATPLTANFIGEFLTFIGSFQVNPILTAISATSMVLVAGYSIWLYNRICFGNESMYLVKAKDLTRREFFLLLPLVILTFLLGIYPNIILDSIHFSVSTLLNSHSDNFIYALFPTMAVWTGKKDSYFANLNKEETANLIENIGNTVADGTIAFTTVATGVTVSNVSNPTVRATVLGVGASTGILSAVTVKTISKIVASNIRNAPDSLGDNNRPPSPGDVTDPGNWTANSPLESFWSWIDPTNMIETNPEYVLLICVYLFNIFNLIFLLYIIGNYVFRNWISPKIESKIKSKWLLRLLDYNKKVSIVFFYYSYFMMLFINLNIVISLSVLIFYTNPFNSPMK